jgi:hypothetical protein
MNRTSGFNQTLLWRLNEEGWSRLAVQLVTHWHDARGHAGLYCHGEAWVLQSNSSHAGLTADVVFWQTPAWAGEESVRVGFSRPDRRQSACWEGEQVRGQPGPGLTQGVLESLIRLRAHVYLHGYPYSEAGIPPFPAEPEPGEEPIPCGGAQWLTISDAGQVPRFRTAPLGERKLRLFACACCRRLPRVI